MTTCTHALTEYAGCVEFPAVVIVPNCFADRLAQLNGTERNVS